MRNVDIAPVQINTEEVVTALKTDEEFFIQFFLGDELTLPVPEFHIDIFHLMTSTAVARCCFALPRDHAKTTLAKLTCVWYWLFSPYQFIIYLSNVVATAVPAANDVVAFLQTDNFRAVFGEIKWITKQDGIGYYRFKINVPGKSGQMREKECILRALGAGQSIRGINVGHRRPQLAIVDDLEDVENTATEQLLAKLKKWFYGTFRKCLDKLDHKIIQIGNMISSKCMLKEHCESKYWFSRRYGCLLSDGAALWPDAWSIEKLKIDFAEYSAAGMADIWFTEMMNLPMGSGRGVIRPGQIHYLPAPEPGEIEYGFITIDPAISKESWAHKTAIIVHGWTGECWQVCEIAGGTGVDPIELFNQVVGLAYKWRVSIVGIESVAYQASLQYLFRYLADINNYKGLEFFPLDAATRKPQRIAAWAAMLCEKEYAINVGDFLITEQLLQYDPRRKENEDDYIDACAYGVQMIDNYSIEIMQKVSVASTAVPRSGYAFAGI